MEKLNAKPMPTSEMAIILNFGLFVRKKGKKFRLEIPKMD